MPTTAYSITSLKITRARTWWLRGAMPTGRVGGSILGKIARITWCSALCLKEPKTTTRQQPASRTVYSTME